MEERNGKGDGSMVDRSLPLWKGRGDKTWPFTGDAARAQCAPMVTFRVPFLATVTQTVVVDSGLGTRVEEYRLVRGPDQLPIAYRCALAHCVYGVKAVERRDGKRGGLFGFGGFSDRQGPSALKPAGEKGRRKPETGGARIVRRMMKRRDIGRPPMVSHSLFQRR